ncbi:peptidoglycan-binding domain-containing protein [Kitasatospora sp. NPDC097605]|uniref:peptidoglycan-binding domain-containing protein n=1 Tax=Kitasatospora sp. NPDC097605 TaxID=3157226 RepID=UPI0033231703
MRTQPESETATDRDTEEGRPMPDQHCPTCGTARSAGCGCLVPDGSLDETAVLPHLEGPPLVRPYVPQAVGQVVEPGIDPAAAPPATDPFGTTVLPPAAPPAAPPTAPPAVPPLGPDADAYATTVLPPIASAPVFPPHPQPQPQPLPQPPAAPEPAEDELGVFPFAHGAPEAAPAGGRAARRAAEQQEARGPLARRKGVLIAAGAGLLAVTVGLAYAVTPSSEPDGRAAPVPTATLGLAPVDPTTPAEPSPSAPPPTEDSPSATPTPTRTSAKPSPTRTTASTPPPAAPAATATAAPPAPEPAPAPDPVTTPAAPAPTPTPTTAATVPASPAPTASPTPAPTPTFRTLERGMEGPDVLALQRKLGVVICWQKLPPTGKYDDRTELMVMYFQDINSIRGDARGVYGPNTRAALDNRTGC